MEKKIWERRHFRAFPIRHIGLEMDIWQYILRRKNQTAFIMFFSSKRECFERNGVILAKTKFVSTKPEEEIKSMNH